MLLSTLINCIVAACVLGLFLAVPWVCLPSVTEAFPGHTYIFALLIMILKVNVQNGSDYLI